MKPPKARGASLLRWASLLLAGPGLLGCVTPTAAEREAAQWVTARVMQTSGDMPVPLRPEDDCRRLTTQGSPVLLGFWWRGNSRRRIAMVSPGDPVPPVGSYVRVHLADCNAPLR